MSDIFRQDAVRKLRDPQQLDTAIRLTSTSGWIALVSIGVIIVTAIVWVFAGSLPFRANGLGVLLETDSEIFPVPATISGRIEQVTVAVGDTVKEGQVLARLKSPETEAQLKAAQANFASLKAQRDRRQTQVKEDIATRLGITGDSVTAQERKAKDINDRIAYLRSREKDERDELSRGFITRDTLEETIQAIDTARQELRTADLAIAQARSDQTEFAAGLRRQISELDQQVLEADNRVKILASQFGIEHLITSPADGFVTELSSERGDIVSAGTRLVTISNRGEGLQMYAYLPVSKGKRVKAGMLAKVTPSTVERDIFGSINATVISVGELPASAAELRDKLENAQLVEQMLANGAPIEVLLQLKSNPKTASGLDWSSSVGPPIQITAGTTALATVTVRDVAPIELVVPIVEIWVSGS
ncbi:MAG: NHLP bacteriocin system secretion protein [Rhodospirillaceae bacterium]|jgi:HlyD family secretion protein|nr:NHLP bacteriocin system secretion protein [Rhodospirillaceae bacterium]MBT6537844.1 NHLP bacteriocin system secretion protein [Rhodospirillaceae bacterium]